MGRFDMRRFGAILVFAAAVLVSTYILATAAAPPRPPVVTAAELAAIAQARPVVDAVDQQVDRLRERLTNPPSYPSPARDPFRFGARAEPPRPKPQSMAPAMVERATPVALPAMPKLVAIATNVVDGMLVRTAVLSLGDDLQIVKAGDVFANFSVRSVGIDAVEIADANGQTPGKTFKISLQ